MLPNSRIDSNFLYLVSKLLVVGGALSAIVGAVLIGHVSFFVSLELLGILAVSGGFIIRRKASTFRRRFEWRDGHVKY